MSVYVSMRVKADPDKLEQFAQENQEFMQGIAERARGLGCLHHTFASENGDVIVMDEWESREAFEKFFNDADDVRQVMEKMGVQSEPEIHFYKKLNVGDEF